MVKQVERRIHYNLGRAPYPNENFVRWYFLIINETKEIDRIRERIHQRLQPFIEEPRRLARGSIPSSGGINYELFYLITELGEFSWNRYQAIYGGKWKKDRTLENLGPNDEARVETILKREGLL